MKYLLTTVFTALAFTLSAQIDHVEPLNWWVGMNNPKLQLLVNGKNIGETNPVIQYAGVTIEKVTRGGSKNYLFIDLSISKDANPGTLNIDFMKGKTRVATYNYALLARQQDASQLKGFNSSDVIYLLVPDRFANGDYKNDVVIGMKENKVDRKVDGARHGGDLRGIINNLDYLQQMGFTALWPTPLLENNMDAYSYHGYAITNHYKVDPRFGTLNDYKELALKAKQKGIKLIFDEVLNHAGTGYWWMNDLPFTNWLNKADSFQLTNHRRTVNEDLYASEYDKDILANGWFDKTMADMNGQNPYMANYLIQSTLWWIETLQLGGVRQDTYGYSDKNFLKAWSCRILEEYPNFSTVGEEWSLNPIITSYWQKGKVNRDGYESCLTTTMDFPIQSALVEALKEPDNPNFGKGLYRLYEALANDIVYADPNHVMLLGDNHDMDRLLMQLDQDVDLTKIALTYLLTIRGIPQIYYGTEILMDNTPYHKNDGLIRADFPGGWKEDSINAFNGKGLTKLQLGMQQYLKKLLNWRKNNAAISQGKTLHFAPYDGIYVYFRYTNEKMVMVAINKNNNKREIDMKRFAEILIAKIGATDIISGNTLSLKQPLLLNPKSASIFEIN